MGYMLYRALVKLVLYDYSEILFSPCVPVAEGQQQPFDLKTQEATVSAAIGCLTLELTSACEWSINRQNCSCATNWW